MTQYTSWEGVFDRQYTRLGFIGGYVRYRNRRLGAKGGISNTEYIVSNDYSNRIVAIAGKAITPRKDNIQPHYHHYYGNDKTANKVYTEDVKPTYDQRIKKLARL